MKNKKTHLRLTEKEVELSRLLFQWAEIWYSDEATHEASNKVYRDFLNKHRKVKRILNPTTVRKLLNAYSDFCDAIKEIDSDLAEVKEYENGK